MYISLFYGFWAPPPTISDIRVPICGSYTPFQGNLCHFIISRDILTPFMGSMASRNGLETRNIQILPPPIHFSSHNTYQYRYLDHKLHFKSLCHFPVSRGILAPFMGSVTSRDGSGTKNIPILTPSMNFSSHKTDQYQFLGHKLHFKAIYVIFLYLGVFWPLLWDLWRHKMGQELKISKFDTTNALLVQQNWPVPIFGT